MASGRWRDAFGPDAAVEQMAKYFVRMAEAGYDRAFIAEEGADLLKKALTTAFGAMGSFGVAVRRDLVFPDRDLHHLLWVLSDQKKRHWRSIVAAENPMSNPPSADSMGVKVRAHSAAEAMAE